MRGRAQVTILVALVVLAFVSPTAVATHEDAHDLTKCKFGDGDSLQEAVEALFLCPLLELGRGVANIISALTAGVASLVITPFLAIFSSFFGGVATSAENIALSLGENAAETMEVAHQQLTIAFQGLPGPTKALAPLLATVVQSLIVGVMLVGSYLLLSVGANASFGAVESVLKDSDDD